MRLSLGKVKIEGWSRVSFQFGSLKSSNQRKSIDVCGRVLYVDSTFDLCSVHRAAWTFRKGQQ